MIPLGAGTGLFRLWRHVGEQECLFGAFLGRLVVALPALQQQCALFNRHYNRNRHYSNGTITAVCTIQPAFYRENPTAIRKIRSEGKGQKCSPAATCWRAGTSLSGVPE